MILKKITLRGFKSYKNLTTIDFSKMSLDQIFLIVGKTGAGKSSILDAIIFALFGNFKDQKTSSYDYLNASFFELYQKKALAKNHILCQVELEFEYKGSHYSCERIIKTKNFRNCEGDLSKLLEKEEHIHLLDNGNKIPLSKLPFFVDYDHFRKMVVIPQNQFSDFIKMDGEEKAEFLSKIFSLDEVINFIDFVKEEKANREKNFEMLQNSIHLILKRNKIEKDLEDPTLIEEFENNINEIKIKLHEITEEIVQKTNIKNQKQNEFNKRETLIKKWKEYNESLKEKNSLEQRKKEIEEKEEIVNQAKRVLELYSIQERLENIEVDLKNKSDELEKNKNTYKELEEINSQVETQKQEFDLKKEIIEEKFNERKEKEDIESKITNFEKVKTLIENLAREGETLNQKKQELENLRERRKEELLKMDQNLFEIYKVSLALSLKEGSPCPICGATSHPAPYKREDLTINPDELLKKREKLKQDIEKKESEIKKIDIEMKANEEKKHEKEIEIRSTEEAIQKYYPNIQIADVKERVKKDLDELKKAIQEYEINYNSLLEKEKELQKKLGETQGNITQLEKTISELNKEKEKKNNELEQKLKERNLKREDIKKFYKDQKEIQKLEEEIQKYKNDITEINSKIDVLSKDIEELYPNFFNLAHKEKEMENLQKNLEILKREIQKLEEEIRQKNQEVGSLQEKFNSLSNDLNDLKVNLEEHKKFSKELQVLSLLYKILNGEYANNLPFDRYLLQVYFDIIVQNANIRLKSINERYHLVTTVEREKQRQKKYGLGLRIYDQYHGVERPIYDLSGGETFYVSLALALGLNDMFYQRAPQAQFDFLFIDEGFGSLDQDTLDTVIRTLNEYFINKSRNRQVGLISHVESMKERFSNQIIVENDRGASKVRYKN